VTRKRLVLAAVVVGLATAGGVAYSGTPADSVVFNGCMHKTTGAVRLIDPTLSSSSPLSRCTNAEQAISWNQRGAAGKDGVDGSNGAPGINGTNGKDGVDGAACLPSVPGCTGPQGPAGADGAPGPKGDPCSPEEKRCVGPAGPAGPAGNDGSPGQQGPSGTAIPAVRTVMVIPAFNRPTGSIPPQITTMFSSPDFGDLEATCEIGGHGSSSIGPFNEVGAHISANDTTGPSTRMLVVGQPLELLKGTAGRALVSVGANVFASSPRTTLAAGEFTLVRYTTDADGTTHLGTEHVAVGIEILPDSSCRMSLTIVDDQ
jgi:collagen triple helix repeat protein